MSKDADETADDDTAERIREGYRRTVALQVLLDASIDNVSTVARLAHTEAHDRRLRAALFHWYGVAYDEGAAYLADLKSGLSARTHQVASLREERDAAVQERDVLRVERDMLRVERDILVDRVRKTLFP